MPVWAMLVIGALMIAAFSAAGTSSENASDRPSAKTTLPAQTETEATSTELEMTTTVAPEPANVGTRENPVPLGQAVRLEDIDGSTVWEVTVLSAGADITAAVAQENQFNDAPPAGSIFYGLTVRITLIEAAEEPVSPWLEFSWSMFSPSKLQLIDEGCGVIPGDVDDLAELFVGASIEGAKCWPVTTADASAAPLLALQPLFGEYVYLATA